MDEFVKEGMAVETARAAAAEHGYTLRVFQDGDVGHATGDLKQDRLNVEAEGGVVTRILGTW